jgi:hypothetical protein
VTQAGYFVGNDHVLLVLLTHEGGGPAYQPLVRATYYHGGASLAVAEGHSSLRMLRAGETTFVAVRSPAPIGWDRYELEPSHLLTTSARTYTHNDLVLTEVRSGRDGATVLVTGRVTNAAAHALAGVRLPVGLFDPDGTLIDTAYAAPFGGQVAHPGQSAAFSVAFSDPAGRVPPGHTYTVQAEGYLV